MTILGSGMAMIDATIVNVALPDIGRTFDAPFATLQWVVTGYALTLAAFILLGGCFAAAEIARRQASERIERSVVAVHGSYTGWDQAQRAISFSKRAVI